MRYFKCIEWEGFIFTPGKVYDYDHNRMTSNTGSKEQLHSWMVHKFVEVYPFSNYFKEVEKLENFTSPSFKKA